MPTIKNILDYNHDFKTNLQSDIDRVRQKLEKEYAKSGDDNEDFQEISDKLVTKLLSMLKKASAENNLLKRSAELYRISRLITIFINQYPEVSETKFGKDLKSWLNLVQINALGFEWMGRLDNAIQSKDELDQIKQYILGYQQAKEFAEIYWAELPPEEKENLEKIAKNYQEESNFLAGEAKGLKQKIKKSKFQIYLFLLSIKDGLKTGSFRNFFDEYKKAVTSCVSFILSKAKADAELSNFKEAQELKAMLEEPTSSIDWEEEKAFMMMLIADMEEARQGEYPPEEIAAFEEMLKKFIE